LVATVPAVVVIVIVVVTAPPVGVTDFGANAHVDFAGSPEQANWFRLQSDRG
jgi:hypothetical protein